MRYRISEIKLDIRQSQEELPTAVRKKVKKKDLDLSLIHISDQDQASARYG